MASILMISASGIIYMAFGYALLRHLFRKSSDEPSVMMSGFDRVAYEDGIEYRKQTER